MAAKTARKTTRGKGAKKTRRKRPTKPPAHVSSLKLLAERVGVSLTSIKRYTKRPGFPDKTKFGWNVAATEKWRHENLTGDPHTESGGGAGVIAAPNGSANGSAGGWNLDDETVAEQLENGTLSILELVRLLKDNPKRLAETLDKFEAFRKKQIENAIKAGQYVPKDILDQAIVGLANMFVGVMDEWVQALPQQLAGLDPTQIEPILEARIRSSRERILNDGKIKLATAKEVAEFHKATLDISGPPPADSGGEPAVKKRGRGRPPTRSQ